MAIITFVVGIVLGSVMGVLCLALLIAGRDDHDE